MLRSWWISLGATAGGNRQFAKLEMPKQEKQDPFSSLAQGVALPMYAFSQLKGDATEEERHFAFGARLGPVEHVNLFSSDYIQGLIGK